MITSAEDFYTCAAKLVKGITVVFVTRELICRHKDFFWDERWIFVQPIQGLQSKHFFRSLYKFGLVVGHITDSKYEKYNIFLLMMKKGLKYHEVYSESDEDQHKPILPVTAQNVKHGSYALVEFQSRSTKKAVKYRYVAICQGEDKKDGEVKIMCLRVCDGEKAQVFRFYENYVSHVSYRQLIGILPEPTIKHTGNRLH